jgi:hypothetical protein
VAELVGARMATLVLVAGAALLAVGCGPSTTSSDPPAATVAPSPSSPVTASPGTTDPGAATAPSGGGSGATTLRAVRTRSFECGAPTLAAQVVRVPVADIVAVMVCPLELNGASASPHTIGPSSSAYAPLLSALSAPDQPRTAHACPAYAEVAETVMARTPSGAFRVSIPVDSCGHHQLPAASPLQNVPAG